MSSSYVADQNQKDLKADKLTNGTDMDQVEITMPPAEGGLLPAIISIDIEHPILATGKYSKWALCAKSQDAFPNSNAQDVIMYGKRTVAITTSGAIWNDVMERVKNAGPKLISLKSVWLVCMQDTGSSHTYRATIGWIPRYAKGVKQETSIKTVVNY